MHGQQNIKTLQYFRTRVWHKLLGAELKLTACCVVRRKSLGRGTVLRTKKTKEEKIDEWRKRKNETNIMTKDSVY